MKNKGDEIKIGPLTFEVLSDGVGVSTEEEYCGLLDNFYEHTWDELTRAVGSAGRILVAKEKHGDFYYAAGDDDSLAVSALKILRERWDAGYWYEEPEEQPAIMTADEIAALPNDTLKGAALRSNATVERDRRYHENHVKWWDSTKALLEMPEEEALKMTYSMFTGRLHFVVEDGERKIGSPMEEVPMAWYLLQFRKEAEYEYVTLDEVRS